MKLLKKVINIFLKTMVFIEAGKAGFIYMNLI